MPRRSPGALRAQKRLRRVDSRRFSQISGLGRSAQAAVRRLEADRFSPGCLRESLDQFEQFLASRNVSSRSLPENERDKLFEEFLKWSSTRY